MTRDFSSSLNPSQLEAVYATEGPVLVIAGAGSGKTRTIVYRLAHLVEQGVSPSSILLLTFTRKASQEMLQRAADLLGEGRGLARVQGGTFHAFAYGMLRRHTPPGWPDRLTVIDRSDAESLIREAKAELGFGKGDRSFPKASTILDNVSKSRNKEFALRDILSNESFHLLPYADEIETLGDTYDRKKRACGMLDYDDLLFALETLLRSDEELLTNVRRRFEHVMVDEYQDTNLVQARLVELIAGKGGNVMAVGDDAQSIYSFRGANVQNILSFPQVFPGARTIRLERNYRSTQPILGFTNQILAQSRLLFEKKLWTEDEGGPTPQIIRPLSDLSQARLVAGKIVELRKEHPPGEIAVLFRAGYQSYHLEVELNKLGIRFAKFGGLKYTEAAHIKDVLSFVRILRNPSDTPSWHRVLAPIKGVGPKTSARLVTSLLSGDREYVDSWRKKRPELDALLGFLDELRSREYSPGTLLEQIVKFYTPQLEERYPDDYPRREAGLEELLQIAAGYKELDLFLADLSLENPEPRGGEREEVVTLSTIHSSKGLEWNAVCIIDLIEDRFPSRHAMNRVEEFEEERRLLYVACTRARKYLALFVPKAVYRRGKETTEPATASPFVREIPGEYYEEWQENYTGGLSQTKGAPEYRRPPSALNPPQQRTKPSGTPGAAASAPPPPAPDPSTMGFCNHKVFGRGKIVAVIPPDKYRVNFPGFGLKVILAQYLEMEGEQGRQSG
ncbi:ATP-dependent helicase [Oceanidesulfovibrio indonesiensis]|uniref:DNA 3'-5' helicase n=1 Tax=Oceanidesulfovibrio indonesiensis TaxID=54767 RepID=A0A7M3ME24_9BACT|nr:ATP-dependent helicase [Oceanidesulfovibrio indonesiensis]TVM17066.1 ATP-dependent helicase [Oceanidesulfovibrio indonesiensis]